MSADRGDMRIGVIWVLPGGGEQCISVAGARIGCLTARVPVHRWACSLVVWAAITGRRGRGIAVLRLTIFNGWGYRFG
jgi:hypothetical protein